jgi:hypothetical protein
MKNPEIELEELMQVAQVNNARKPVVRRQFSELDIQGKIRLNDAFKWGIIKNLAKNKNYEEDEE